MGVRFACCPCLSLLSHTFSFSSSLLAQVICDQSDYVRTLLKVGISAILLGTAVADDPLRRNPECVHFPNQADMNSCTVSPDEVLNLRLAYKSAHNNTPPIFKKLLSEYHRALVCWARAVPHGLREMSRGEQVAVGVQHIHAPTSRYLSAQRAALFSPVSALTLLWLVQGVLRSRPTADCPRRVSMSSGRLRGRGRVSWRLQMGARRE